MTQYMSYDSKAPAPVAWRKQILWAFACALLILVTACHAAQNPDSVFTVEHEVTPQPVRVGPANVILRIKDAAGKSLKGAHMTLEGNMSHPGMGPTMSDATEIEPGLYRSVLDISMSGDWVVLVHIILPDGQKLERQFEINGVQADAR